MMLGPEVPVIVDGGLDIELPVRAIGTAERQVVEPVEIRLSSGSRR